MGDPTGAVLDSMDQAGGTNGLCTPETCDEFTLHVADAGSRLQVDIASTGGSSDFIGVEVEDASGATTFGYEATTAASVSIVTPAAGDYIVRAVGSPGGPATTIGGVPYEATATLLGVAAATPTATVTATAAATATASATATPAPTPAATPAPAAAPPPAPRTLALQADRQRIATAIRRGLRTRTRCTGGCARIEVAAFVSPLTARRLGLGRQRTDIRVAGAPVTSGEGRMIHTLAFTRSLRGRLRRSKRLELAVEAVVIDPDGRRRTAIHRVTLTR